MVKDHIVVPDNGTQMRDKHSMPAIPDSRKDAGKLALDFYIKVCLLLDLADKGTVKLFAKPKRSSGEVPYVAKLDIIRIFSFPLGKEIFAFVMYDSYDDRDDFWHKYMKLV